MHVAMLKEVLLTFLSPLGVLAVLFVVGILFTAFRRRSSLGPRTAWSGVGMYLLLALTPLAELIYAKLEHPFPAMLHPDASVKNVVVLVGYGEDLQFLPVTSKLSVDTVSRMAEGIRLHRELADATLILSGGPARHEGRTNADLAAEFAVAMGVPEQSIVLERRSATTYENLLEVNKIIGSAPFILVTSSEHLRRATAVAQRLGMNPLPAPAAIWAARYYPAGMSWGRLGWKLVEDTGPQNAANRLQYIQRAYYEHVGYMWYWMLGHV